MKRFCAFLLLLSIIVCLCPAMGATENVMKEFYVNPVSGSDSGKGTVSAPFLTVERARVAVREYITKNGGRMTGNIVVNLAEGRYELDDYLQFTEADSAKNGFKVIYQGAGAKKSVISGGTEISGWTELSNGVWYADAPELEFARDLYVNERPARRAASQKMIKGVANYRATDSYYDLSDGFYVNKSQMPKFINPEDVVFHWTIAWKDYQICVKDIIDDPQNSERLIVKLENPVWNSIHEIKDLPSTRVRLWPTYDKEFIVENAFELLDEPGEFYFNKKTKKLYYYPRNGENPESDSMIVPTLERLVRVDGSDFYHQATGICFRNMGFAHTTNPLAENTSYCNQQGEFPTCPQQAGNRTPASVEVNRANKIEISDCAVWGTELAGIAFADGVDDSSVSGCSFTDTGSSAAIIGTSISTTVEPADRTALANVVYMKRWQASYNYTISGANTMAFFNGGALGNEFEYRSGAASAPINAHMWKNEPWAARDGIKSWVMFDLEQEYKLESIRLSFEEDCVGTTASDVERSNFEVLLSNDKDFSDYKVVKTFTSPAADVEEIPVDFAECYRYLMIRKTKAEPFAIFGVWAYSYDREPMGRQSSDNVTFSNNYIARAGRVHCQAPAVLVNITKGTKVRNNEIVDSSYTGISLGWGWESVNYIALDNVIENNYIENCSQFTDDGGGIYILGNQNNLKISGNYVKNQGNMYGGIYFDTGSCGATVENNVVVNTSNTFMFWNDVNEISRGPIKIRNTYSDMDQVARYDGDAYIDWEDINVFTPDNPPEEAVAIMTNAGLSSGYDSIRESERSETPWLKGPEMNKSYHRTNAASTRALAYISVAENLLANAQFGSLPWQYDKKDYYAIEKALADIKNFSNRAVDYSNGHILEEYALKEAIEEANAEIEHPTYEKMVEMCDAYISEADTSGGLGSYPQSAVSALQAALNNETASSAKTEFAKALAANRLEKAVAIFEKARIGADLEYAYVSGGVTEVDGANSKITITLPFDAALSGLNIKTSVSNGASLVTNVSGADFTNPVSVTVKNNATGLEKQWTLEIKREEVTTDANLVMNAAPENWINSNPNTVMPSKNNVITFQPTYKPYVYGKTAGTSATWKIKADNPETGTGVSLLFGGKRSDVEPDVKEKNNSYYRLAIIGQNMNLFYGEDGVESQIASTDSASFNYGAYNEVKAAIEGSVLKIYVNGNQKIAASNQSASKFQGYCGIYNTASVVKLASSDYQATLTNVALGRPVFTSWTSSSNEPTRMVDGKTSTAWVSNKMTSGGNAVISGKYIWALVDLGAEYTVDEIKILTEDNDSYISRDRQDYKVYVGKMRPDTNVAPNTPIDVTGMTEVYAAPSISDGSACAPVENIINVAAVPKTGGNKYRYVLLQKTNIADESGETGHWYWAIRDIQVNTSDEYAKDGTYWVEAAKNRPAFAGKVYQDDTYAARNAIDADISTAFIAADWGAGIRSRLIIDLEKEYPIEAVVYTPRYNANELKGYEIYATNDTLCQDMALIHKQPNDTATNYGHLYYEAPDALSGNKFRYVVVQADTANNNLGILDLKVYTSDMSVDYPYMANRTYVTSINTPVSSDCGESGYPFKNLTDVESSTACLVSSGNASGYLSVDLMKPQTVDYVAYAIEGFNLYHYGMEVIASNNKDLSDGAVLYSAKNADGTYFCPVSETDTKGIILFPATEEMKGNKYRYVGIKFPKNTKTATQLVRGGANLFEVYTKGENLQEALSGMTFVQNGTVITASVNDLVTLNDSNYTVAVAAYDESGKQIDVKTAEIPKPTQGKRHATPISVTVDFAGCEERAKIETVKAMLWENMSDTVRPIIEEQEVEIGGYAPVTSSAEVTSYYYQHGSIKGTNPKDTIFTDNDLTTIGGRGQHWDIAWIDLGEAKSLNAVGTTINDAVNVLPYPLVMYVTNDEPGAAIVKSISDNGKFVAPATWTSVNGDGHLLTKTGQTDLFYPLAESGEYRYVICAAPTADFVNDSSLPGLPAYIAEIAAYSNSFTL